jgi:hypothetical protein
VLKAAALIRDTRRSHGTSLRHRHQMMAVLPSVLFTDQDIAGRFAASIVVIGNVVVVVGGGVGEEPAAAVGG